MTIQIITAPNGEEMVVLPKAEYDALIKAANEAAEDAADAATFEAAMADAEGSTPLTAEESRLVLDRARRN